jgi:glycosidase
VRANGLGRAAGAQGRRILVDIVLPHTGDRHTWFRAATASGTALMRTFYV